jgi:signal transduction histidine kinase
MTGSSLLDWTSLAVSLFNTIILLWLGMTVLLNADRRTLGLWIASSELLMGSAFFLSHSIILASGIYLSSRSMNFWWHLGWFPVVLLPYAWYIVMLWYSGFWNEPSSRLNHRHRYWFALSTLLAITIVGLLFFANPLPSFFQIIQLDLTSTLSVFGIPLLILVYPVYIFLCISLSLDVVRHPAPSDRVMGDLARRRARPWLMGASLLQIVVSLLVGWVMLWVIVNAKDRTFDISMAYTVVWFDLIIASIIAVAVLFVGQAIVSYEVFTGKTLPRRGLKYYWRRLILLAIGTSALVSLELTLNLQPVYSLLIGIILIIVFYAILGWRTFNERERYLNYIRPFVSSQQLYGQSLNQKNSTPLILHPREQFDSLCNRILSSHLAYLIPIGPMAPLVGSALVYPESDVADSPAIDALSKQFSTSQSLGMPLDPKAYKNAIWAVPLWSEGGLIGCLLLGEKSEGGLYAQEEIEIAQEVSERIIDTQASAEIARRLKLLQRQRLSESQVLDQQTKRILHDEVLPQLHTIMLNLSEEKETTYVHSATTIKTLSALHHQIADLLHNLPRTTSPEVAQSGLITAIRKMIENDFRNSFEDLSIFVSSEAEQRTRDIPILTAEVLFYATREALRNASSHGRNEETDQPLSASINISWQEGLKIVVEDNGIGLGQLMQGQLDHLQDSGNGQGLALHSTMMAVIGGSLAVESVPGLSTSIILVLPKESWQVFNHS